MRSGLLLLALASAGCNVPLWGNLFVLSVAVGILWGTLTLGRRIQPPPEKVDASSSKANSTNADAAS